jgi:hypothetical protein
VRPVYAREAGLASQPDPGEVRVEIEHDGEV